MDNETLTRILSARFITCNEQTRKGSKGCTKECKLYELQEPGMTCRDSVLLHAEEAKKMFICNRCRKQVFAERFDDGRFDQKALDGWALETRDFFGVGDLCPECFKVYRETMERFYTGGKRGA